MHFFKWCQNVYHSLLVRLENMVHVKLRTSRSDGNSLITTGAEKPGLGEQMCLLWFNLGS